MYITKDIYTYTCIHVYVCIYNYRCVYIYIHIGSAKTSTMVRSQHGYSPWREWRSYGIKFLAFKKTPTPLGPPYDPRHRPIVGS